LFTGRILFFITFYNFDFYAIFLIFTIVKQNVMDNLLLKIMAESFERKAPEGNGNTGSKPFITLSREFGCQANLLATMLKSELDQSGTAWRIMNKEIILSAAQELKMDPEKISMIAGSTDRTRMDEVMHALSSKFYKSDRKIRQTIADVVRNTAKTGHTIIVGRGGAAVTRGMRSAVHVHLIAPVEWRLESLMDRHGWKREEAYKQLTEIDHKRYKLIRDNLKGMMPSEHLFDLTINCSQVTHQEMTGLILKLASLRGLV